MPRVTVLDMQQIDPPVGGGRLRILGLYHGLGEDLDARYLGTYDQPGFPRREQWLSPTMKETLVPLTNEHFAAVRELSHRAGGRNLIDTAFHTQASLSPAFVEEARSAVAESDIVVYSHPWIFPLTADIIDRKRQLLVYDAHNVEGLLRTALLDDGGIGTSVARGVVAAECSLCRAADLILACSLSDLNHFSKLYAVDPARIRVVPNGTFVDRLSYGSSDDKVRAKGRLGLAGRAVALFLGSAYGPNVEAAEFIVTELAPRMPDVCFAIVGSVGGELKSRRRENVVLTGIVDEADKLAWLQAADIAVNPMFGGSGTNIKMLDFMAAGLPIVTTAVGARGIATSAPSFKIASRHDFSDATRALLENKNECSRLSGEARRQAERFYSWEKISGDLGRLLEKSWRLRQGKVKISVVVATYERHESLAVLVRHIAAQTFRNFELIIVDQSAEPWNQNGDEFGFPLTYIHTNIRGAVTSRNRGAALAGGSILAFTDDDCCPPPSWLECANERFETEAVVGLEGLILSEKLNDDEWRAVTNEGFEGVGFMTANMFVRTSTFHKIGGFDRAFEDNHFREDTDLGWRLLAEGAVPFSNEAWIFHPAHRRTVARESLERRSRLFMNDARLLRKHPQRYVDLFFKECQWSHGPMFWQYFFEGLVAEDIPLPKRIHDFAILEVPDLLDGFAGRLRANAS